MDMRKKFQNDPAKFFLYQDRLLSKEDRKRANNFSVQVIDLEQCPLCKHDYDLSLHAPRILVNCGHTLCTECLYMFFKDQKIKCPLCTKFVKRLRAVEVLPLNHTIFHRLSKNTPLERMGKYNSKLWFSNDITEDLELNDNIEYPICEFHNERVKHFVNYDKGYLYCRACIVENEDTLDMSIVDLYLLQPDHSRTILMEFSSVGVDPKLMNGLIQLEE